MPRYVIERRFAPVSEAEMEEMVARAKQVLDERFPEVVWEHSHVVVRDGEIVSFCVYDAPDPDALMRHAEIVGGHTIDSVYEIVQDIDPAQIGAI